MVQHTERQRNEIYHQAIDTFGAAKQQIKAIEEFAELIQAICKNLLGKMDLLNMTEEIADADIMTEQLRILFDNGGAVDRAKDFKLERLEKMLLRYSLK